MILARAALGAQVHDAASKFAPFRSQVVVLHFEFGNRVLVGNQDRQVDIADVDGLAVNILDALVAERAANLVSCPS